jgi:hypothetical protein
MAFIHTLRWARAPENIDKPCVLRYDSSMVWCGFLPECVWFLTQMHFLKHSFAFNPHFPCNAFKRLHSDAFTTHSQRGRIFWNLHRHAFMSDSECKLQKMQTSKNAR